MHISNTISENEVRNSTLMHRSLNAAPHIVDRAEGSYLYLQDGRKILDSCGGAAVVSVGHSNYEVLDAIKQQLSKVTYVHAMEYTTPVAETFANQLLENYKDSLAKVFFANSGSEATEGAYKLAIQYFQERGLTSKTHIISRNQSYHGNCLAGMSISGHIARRKPFEKVIPDTFHKVSAPNEYRDKAEEVSTEQYVARLAAELENKVLQVGPDNVAAFFAETIVGATTGCMTAPKGYFQAIKKICEKYDILLVLDEIMCGSGRTGTFFAWEQEGVVPDITCAGKALSSGYLPLSAIFINHKVISALREGSLSFNSGHTYQSFPLACAAAKSVQDIISREHLLQNVEEKGVYLESRLKDALKACKCVGNIRGRGLFWGIEFVKQKDTKECFPREFQFALKVKDAIYERGVAVYPGMGTADGAAGDHVLIAPSFNITTELIDVIVEGVAAGIEFCESTYL